MFLFYNIAMMELKKAAEFFLEKVEESKKVFVLTGAGISTPSGIPDFRGPQGLYTYTTEEVFDIDTFMRRPEFFYSIARDLYQVMSKAEPNEAHYMLAELERRGKVDLIATQNIDGLHQKAGSRKVVELHGSADRGYCMKCRKEFTAQQIMSLLEKEEIARCECGGVIKPDVVFFGEPLPEEALFRAKQSASQADLCIVMGSSLYVYPAAYLPQLTVINRGKLIIVNKGRTGLDDMAYMKFELDVKDFSRQVIELLK